MATIFVDYWKFRLQKSEKPNIFHAWIHKVKYSKFYFQLISFLFKDAGDN